MNAVLSLSALLSRRGQVRSDAAKLPLPASGLTFAAVLRHITVQASRCTAWLDQAASASRLLVCTAQT